MNIDSSLIKTLTSLPQPAIIGISGFGGSGKTTLAQTLGAEIQAPVISIDSFNKGLESFSYWETMDYKRLLEEIIQPFYQGKEHIVFEHTDGEYTSHQEHLKNTGILIIEGVGILRTELLPFFTYTIWVDCPLEEAIRRGKKRDREVWNNPKDDLWDGIWKKNDLEYFEKYKPAEHADLIMNNIQSVF